MLSCATTKKMSSGSSSQAGVEVIVHDGSSFEKAIVINEKSESKGVGAEYEWLRNNYPGYKTKRQTLSYNNKIPYDIITIVTTQGIEKQVYFDISNFYGKF